MPEEEDEISNNQNNVVETYMENVLTKSFGKDIGDEEEEIESESRMEI